MPDPHPLTGRLFDSPVPPGTGWPGDLATARTPVARTPAGVARLTRTRDLAELDARISVCRACPRLVAWREEVATTGRRAAFADQPYWGRPAFSLGRVDAPIYLMGLAPAANGTNRTGRVFTGDKSSEWLWAGLHRAGLATRGVSVAAGDGTEPLGVRIGGAVRCAPPGNQPTAAEKTTCRPWITRELELLPALRVVLALGGIAWTTAVQVARASGWVVPRPAPRFGHGAEAVLTRPNGSVVTLLGSYHTSQYNTSTGVMTVEMLDAVLARAKELAGLE